jgi:hypothetical protein
MPKYTFTCCSCSKSSQRYVSKSTDNVVCDECFARADRQMPSLASAKTTETVDKLLNRKHLADHSLVLKERKLDYYWEIEVPKMVDSGTYSLETMLEQGWVFYNEKGELTTRTRPPQKS